LIAVAESQKEVLVKEGMSETLLGELTRMIEELEIRQHCPGGVR
jgi:hypothetical protein